MNQHYCIFYPRLKRNASAWLVSSYVFSTPSDTNQTICELSIKTVKKIMAKNRKKTQQTSVKIAAKHGIKSRAYRPLYNL